MFRFGFGSVFSGNVGVSTGITSILGDGLLAALAYVRQQELYPPVGACSPWTLQSCSYTLSCPEDNPEDNSEESLKDRPEDRQTPLPMPLE